MEYNSPESFDLDKITTAEDLLAALRKGNSQKLELSVGIAKVPCRLLNAVEETKIIIAAKQKAAKDNPTKQEHKMVESIYVMRMMLAAGTTVQGAPQLPDGFLESLTSEELADLYDQYVSINHTINPNIQKMKPEEIQALIEGIKKKDVNPKGLYSYQYAALGQFFVEVLIPSLPTDN